MEVVKMRNPFELFPMEIWEVFFDQMEDSKCILIVLHGIPKLGISIGNQKRMWLIDQILPSLYNLIDQKDVLNLRLVCKQWLRRVDFFLQNQPYYRAYSEDLHKDNLKFWDFLNQYEKNKFGGPVVIELNVHHADDANPGLADEIMEYSQSTRRNPFVFRELSLKIEQHVPSSNNDNSFEKVFAFLEQVGTHVWYLHIRHRATFSYRYESGKIIQTPEATPLANLLKHTPNLKRLHLTLPFSLWKDALELKPNETNLPELPFLETIEISPDVRDVLTFESLLFILNRYGSQLRRLKIPLLKRWDVNGLANLFPQLTELELDVYISNIPYEVEDFIITNTRIILGSILSPNLAKLQINTKPSWHFWEDGDDSNDPHQVIFSVEGDVLKWLKRFPRMKYFELLNHPLLPCMADQDEIIMKEDGTSDPNKDLVSSLQTFKIVDPGHRLSYNFLRCFPSLRTLQIQSISRKSTLPMMPIFGQERERVFVQKMYESNIWKVLPKLRTASFAEKYLDDDDDDDDYWVKEITTNHFDRETFLKLKDAGKIPAESQLPSSSTTAIQIFE